MRTRAVALLSGGQDSTTSLFWAKQRFGEIHAVSFDYGQRHVKELESAQMVAKLAGVESYRILEVPALRQLAGGALTDPEQEVKAEGGHQNLPTTFVPGRNVIFLTLAAALACKIDAKDLVTGVCQTDYSGYFDCRRLFIDAMETALNAAIGVDFAIHTPLMFLTKAQSVQMARSIKGCFEALAWTHTCYFGQFPPCGKCPACLVRAKGFAEAKVKDPLEERAETARLSENLSGPAIGPE